MEIVSVFWSVLWNTTCAWHVILLTSVRHNLSAVGTVVDLSLSFFVGLFCLRLWLKTTNTNSMYNKYGRACFVLYVLFVKLGAKDKGVRCSFRRFLARQRVSWDVSLSVDVIWTWAGVIWPSLKTVERYKCGCFLFIIGDTNCHTADQTPWNEFELKTRNSLLNYSYFGYQLRN